MKISIISFGHKLESFEEEWLDVYRQRLRHFTKIEWHRIDIKKNTGDAEIFRQIEKKTAPGAQIALLDESGKSFSTAEFKSWIEKQENQSKDQVCFIIGGSYGFSKEILKKFPFHITLSKFTMPHKLALLLLFEQLYRVYSWKAGYPYHHE